MKNEPRVFVKHLAMLKATTIPFMLLNMDPWGVLHGNTKRCTLPWHSFTQPSTHTITTTGHRNIIMFYRLIVALLTTKNEVAYKSGNSNSNLNEKKKCIGPDDDMLVDRRNVVCGCAIVGRISSLTYIQKLI